MGIEVYSPFKPVVLLTGFGPFEGVPVNASWEAVRTMDKHEIEKRLNCELVVHEIPVTYQGVNEIVPDLWGKYSPRLVIHVGVSNIANCLTIEKRAHREDYRLVDCMNKCPSSYACPAEGSNVIHTKLDVDRICGALNGNTSGEMINAIPSKDAGRYLCEYIYYTSLSQDNSKTLFVHVPDLDIYSPEISARGLESIVCLCFDQLNEAEEVALF